MLVLINLSLFLSFIPHCFIPPPPIQENINIDEAANCLVKHIIASENDMLQSEVPDTISPQLEKEKGGTCSSCFRSQ